MVRPFIGNSTLTEGGLPDPSINTTLIRSGSVQAEVAMQTQISLFFLMKFRSKIFQTIAISLLKSSMFSAEILLHS